MNDFKNMDDAELSALICDAAAERERRNSVPEDQRPDTGIKKRLAERHERLYGNKLGKHHGGAR